MKSLLENQDVAYKPCRQSHWVWVVNTILLISIAFTIGMIVGKDWGYEECVSKYEAQIIWPLK